MTDRGHMKRFALKYVPKTKRAGKPIEINPTGNISKVISIGPDNQVAYVYTTAGAFELDPMNIKSTTRLGKNQRIIELKSTDYTFDLV